MTATPRLYDDNAKSKAAQAEVILCSMSGLSRRAKSKPSINYLLKVIVKHAAAFDEFLDGLQTNIKPSVTREEAIEMLAQHMITCPVFEALFESASFVNNNVISQSMQKMLELLETHSLGKESETSSTTR